jgi:hypothetical protein
MFTTWITSSREFARVGAPVVRAVRDVAQQLEAGCLESDEGFGRVASNLGSFAQ